MAFAPLGEVSLCRLCAVICRNIHTLFYTDTLSGTSNDKFNILYISPTLYSPHYIDVPDIFGSSPLMSSCSQNKNE